MGRKDDHTVSTYGESTEEGSLDRDTYYKTFATDDARLSSVASESIAESVFCLCCANDDYTYEEDEFVGKQKQKHSRAKQNKSRQKDTANKKEKSKGIWPTLLTEDGGLCMMNTGFVGQYIYTDKQDDISQITMPKELQTDERLLDYNRSVDIRRSTSTKSSSEKYKSQAKNAYGLGKRPPFKNTAFFRKMSKIGKIKGTGGDDTSLYEI